MAIGGYQIIDFKNFHFDGSNSVVIKGLYNLINNTTKPILLANFYWTNLHFRNMWVNFITIDEINVAIITFGTSIISIAVSSSDTVTVIVEQ